MEKKIIVDCDGVLLDWVYAFDIWMLEHGYKKKEGSDGFYSQSYKYGISQKEANDQISKFNQSGCVGFIPPYKDSVEYVKKISILGWRFEVISSLERDKHSQKLRVMNLHHLFGNVFDFIDCGLDYKKDKYEYLKERYSGKTYYWIEDSTSNAIAGKNIGLNSIIMDHEYNKDWDGPRIKKWEDLYNMIKK